VRHLEELTSVIGVGLDAMDIVRTGSKAGGSQSQACPRLFSRSSMPEEQNGILRQSCLLVTNS
jgi:hypothetical protein